MLEATEMHRKSCFADVKLSKVFKAEEVTLVQAFRSPLITHLYNT